MLVLVIIITEFILFADFLTCVDRSPFMDCKYVHVHVTFKENIVLLLWKAIASGFEIPLHLPPILMSR